MSDAGTSPELSIVVLLTHDGEQAQRCLDSIAAHAVATVDCEVILILNDSSAAVRHVVKQRAFAATLVDSKTNVGTSVGWQLGFNAARGPRVLLMHEDAELTAGLVADLIATLNSDPVAAVVAPWLIERSQAEPNNCGWIWFEDQSQTRLTTEHIPEQLRHTPYAVDGVSSAISLWDRKSWLEGGGFDERNFPALGVDADACTSAWARGRSVLVDPRLIGIHRTGAMDNAPSRLSGKFVRYFMLERFERLWLEKWGAMQDWYAPARAGSPPNTLERPALLAIQRRRERHPRIDGPFTPAAHPFTDPEGKGSAPTSVSADLAKRLRAAELQAMDEYHHWLIAHSESQHAEIEHLSEAIREMSAREEALLEDWHQRGKTIERLRPSNSLQRRISSRLRKLRSR